MNILVSIKRMTYNLHSCGRIAAKIWMIFCVVILIFGQTASVIQAFAGPWSYSNEAVYYIDSTKADTDVNAYHVDSAYSLPPSFNANDVLRVKMTASATDPADKPKNKDTGDFGSIMYVKLATHSMTFDMNDSDNSGRAYKADGTQYENFTIGATAQQGVPYNWSLKQAVDDTSYTYITSVPADPQRHGYSFGGWDLYEQTGTSGDTPVYKATASAHYADMDALKVAPITHNVKLVAVWTADNYSLSFSATKGVKSLKLEYADTSADPLYSWTEPGLSSPTTSTTISNVPYYTHLKATATLHDGYGINWTESDLRIDKDSIHITSDANKPDIAGYNESTHAFTNGTRTATFTFYMPYSASPSLAATGVALDAAVEFSRGIFEKDAGVTDTSLDTYVRNMPTNLNGVTDASLDRTGAIQSPSRNNWTFEGWWKAKYEGGYWVPDKSNDDNKITSYEQILGEYGAAATYPADTTHIAADWQIVGYPISATYNKQGLNSVSVNQNWTMEGISENKTDSIPEDGTLNITAPAGAPMTLSASLKSGYVNVAWKITDKDGTKIEPTYPTSGVTTTATFTMPGGENQSVTISAKGVAGAAKITLNYGRFNSDSDKATLGNRPVQDELDGFTDETLESLNYPTGKIPVPTKAGWKCLGWFASQADNAAQVENYPATFPNASSTTYYAKWQVNTKSATFSRTGKGITDVVLNQTKTLTPTSGDPAIYEWESYTFSNTEPKEMTKESEIPAGTKVTMRATLKSQGYTDIRWIVSGLTQTDNEPANQGEYRASTINNRVSTVTFIMPADNVGIRAQGVAETAKITFDANAGGDVTVANMPKGISGRVDQDIADTFPSASPTRAGYSFSGWYTVAADTGGERKTEYPSAFEYVSGNASNETIYYARWTSNLSSSNEAIKVKFDKNDSGITLENLTTTYGFTSAQLTGLSSGTNAITSRTVEGTIPGATNTGGVYTSGNVGAAITAAFPAGTANPAALTLNVNNTKTVDNKPVATTYTLRLIFAGWAETATGRTATTAFPDLFPDSDKTYYAIWKADMVATGPTSVTVTDGVQTSPTTPITLESEMKVLLATHNVTYKMNDGTDRTWATTTSVPYGNAAPALTTTPVRDGYTFDSWYKDPGCTELFTAASEPIASNTEVYAGWNDAITYDLTVSWTDAEGSVECSNGPTGLTGGAVANGTTYHVAAGTTLKLQAKPNANYYFAAWTGAPEGSAFTHSSGSWVGTDGSTKIDGDIIEFTMPAQPVTLGAVFDSTSVGKLLPRANFNKENGDADTFDIKADVDGKLSNAEMPTVKKAGYDLEGWYTHNALGQKGDRLVFKEEAAADPTKTATVITANTDFFAYWTKKANVAITLKGGLTDAIQDEVTQSVTTLYYWPEKGFVPAANSGEDALIAADSAVIASDKLPTRPGYKPLGYWTKKASASEYDTQFITFDGKAIDVDAAKRFTEAATLYADWEEVYADYTVKYVEKGATPEKEIANAKTGKAQVSKQVAETAIAIPGYTLDGAKTQTITIDEDETKNVITFEYTTRAFSVTFVNGTNEKVESVNYNELVTRPTPDPTNAAAEKDKEYNFDGWYLEGTTTRWNFADDRVTHDITLEARFTEIDTTKDEYTIKYYLETTAERVDGEAQYGSDPSQTVKVQDGTTFTTASFDTCPFIGFIKDSVRESPEKTFNVYYKRDSFDVTYAYTGDVATGASPTADELASLKETHRYGESVTVAAAPTAPGARFKGWYTVVDDVSGVAGSAFYMPANNVPFTGSWAAFTYTITVHGCGHGGTETQTITGLKYGDALTNLKFMKARGFAFGGYWDSLKDGGTQWYSATESATATGMVEPLSSHATWTGTDDIDLYAKWTGILNVSVPTNTAVEFDYAGHMTSAGNHTIQNDCAQTIFVAGLKSTPKRDIGKIFPDYAGKLRLVLTRKGVTDAANPQKILLDGSEPVSIAKAAPFTIAPNGQVSLALSFDYKDSTDEVLADFSSWSDEDRAAGVGTEIAKLMYTVDCDEPASGA